MCVCSGQSWGYMPDDPPQSFPWLIRMLTDVISRGGNWLVNIGPDRNGRVPEAVRARMREVGDWIRAHADGVYGTQAGPWEPVDEPFGSTCKGDTVHLFIQDPQVFSRLALPPVDGLPSIKKAVLLHENGGEACQLALTQDETGVRVSLPEGARVTDREPVLVVRLTAEGEVHGRRDEDIYFKGK